MASSFPGSIDNFTDPLSNSALSSPSHAGQHSDLNDAVEKIETYVLKLPRGLVTTTSGGTNSLGYVTGIAAFSSTAGVTNDVTSSSMTFTGISGRLYRYSTSAYCASTSASGLATLAVTDASNNIKWVAYANITNTSGGSWIGCGYVFTAVGSTTVKLRWQGITGTCTIFASNSLGAITLEDIGPSA
jgi:hypothetical protein